MLPLVVLLIAALQSPALDRTRAEQLARAGRTTEAMEIFVHLIELDPTDVEARTWVARLALRLGRVDEAEEEFRSVLRDHPADVDACIGLGRVLTRRGYWQDALATLHDVEPIAGENADLFSTLARAYRQGGNAQKAFEYFQKAKRLAADDPDVVAGFETVARSYGHWIAFEGVGQGGAPGADLGSGTVTVGVRTTPRLHFDAAARIQHGSDYSDAIVGGGLIWQAGRTTIASHWIGGSGNVALPDSDLSAEVMHYPAAFEIGGSVHRLSFVDGTLVGLSPVVAWNLADRWRLDGRYTYSRTSFNNGKLAGDHSGLLRESGQVWRRVAVQAAYAYGIESFEQVTADRLGSLGASTLAAGIRIDVPSLTRITATWEHQWRTNSTSVDRLTLSIVQSIP